MLSVDGMDLVEPTADREPPPGLAGAILAPWPNRVEGAQWTLDGIPQYLEVTEPALGHANHGLLLDSDYEIVSHSADEITLRSAVDNEPGFPFHLEVGVRYRLESRGIRVTHSVHNRSPVAAPFATGAHPYLRVGADAVDQLVVQVVAERALALDEGHIPRGEFEVAGSDWDLSRGRRVDQAIPHAAYSGLALEQGLHVHRLRSQTATVELWSDPAFAWLQLYVATDFASLDGVGTAIAVEPMTAPPNALRTGEGLMWLQPDARWSAEWGIRLA